MSFGVSTHSRLKAAGKELKTGLVEGIKVSTHSRLKAAGNGERCFFLDGNGFNTQPPKGGWDRYYLCINPKYGFNTQPPKGGWPNQAHRHRQELEVSTHSRLKAAGNLPFEFDNCFTVSTHSRLKAAGQYIDGEQRDTDSFNTQPPKGGWVRGISGGSIHRHVSTHSRLKAAGRL